VAYAPVIIKDQIKTIIRTTVETIEGMVHKRPRNRLLDTLNLDDEQFIAVSDAKVYSDEDGKLVHDTDFIAVNKSHIISITGDEIKTV
jgi:hypothetical protein